MGRFGACLETVTELELSLQTIKNTLEEDINVLGMALQRSSKITKAAKANTHYAKGKIFNTLAAGKQPGKVAKAISETIVAAEGPKAVVQATCTIPEDPADLKHAFETLHTLTKGNFYDAIKTCVGQSKIRFDQSVTALRTWLKAHPKGKSSVVPFEL